MLKKLIPSVLLAAAIAATLYAQATTVQQVPAHLDAATTVTTNVASGTTSTLTPNGGETVYIYQIDIENCAGTAVTPAAQTNITTTNLTGSPIWQLSSGSTTGVCAQIMSIAYPTGLKATTPGTAVTFVLPAFATNQTVRLNVAWRSAPPL